jgi:hypothetical protein
MIIDIKKFIIAVIHILGVAKIINLFLFSAKKK